MKQSQSDKYNSVSLASRICIILLLSSCTNGKLEFSDRIRAAASDSSGGSGTTLINLTKPDIQFSALTVTEGTIVQYTISLSAPSTQSVTLDYSTNLTISTAQVSTATVVGDYVPAQGTLTYLPGETTKIVTLVTNYKPGFAPDRNIVLTLSNLINANPSAISPVVTITDAEMPTAITTDVISVDLSHQHGCAIRVSLISVSSLYCWGENEYGEVGDPASPKGTIVPQPKMVISDGVTKVAVGGYPNQEAFSCAVVNGGAMCWGKMSLGFPNPASNTPTFIPGFGPGSGVTDISVSDHFGCLIKLNSLYCWGQLNLLPGGYAATATPVAITFPALNMIAVGASHFCGITTDGAIFCQGANSVGQLGNTIQGGNPSDSTIPVQAIGITSGATKISTGAHSTCAIVNGGLRCWGGNNSGQMGIGVSGVNQTEPVITFADGSGVTDVAVGGNTWISDSAHICAVKNSSVFCWGANDFGQFGDGTTAGRNFIGSPLGISATAVAAGPASSCLVTKTGELKCFGNTDLYQLGIGIGQILYRPVDPVGAGSGVTEVSVATTGTCAIINGTAKCWGTNVLGRIGDGTQTNQTVPTNTVSSVSGAFVKVVTSADGFSVTTDHSCGMTGNGLIYCWGSNYAGALGSNPSGFGAYSLTPKLVPGISGAVDIAVGANKTCAALSGGSLWCWGMIMPSNPSLVSLPTAISGISQAQKISMTRTHICVIDGGAAKCMGQNTYGQLGIDPVATNSSDSFVQVSGLTSGVTDIGAFVSGDSTDPYSCAIQYGIVKCWGINANFRFGNGTSIGNYNPQPATLLTELAQQINITGFGVCALTITGSVKCWGSSQTGGWGSSVPQTSPQQVVGLSSSIKSLATNGGGSQYSVCAISTTGSLKCWGTNSIGQLGTGYASWVLTPQPIPFQL